MSDIPTKGEMLGTALRHKIIESKNSKIRQQILMVIITLLIMPHKNVAHTLMFASRLFYTLSQVVRVVAV